MFFITTTSGDTQEKAINEFFEKLEPLEEGLKGLFPEGCPYVDSKNVGLLDILMCGLCGPYRVEEEVVGLKVIDPQKFPIVFSWVKALSHVPEIMELTPPHDKLVAALQSFAA